MNCCSVSEAVNNFSFLQNIQDLLGDQAAFYYIVFKYLFTGGFFLGVW
jgi:hypothetical protein